MFATFVKVKHTIVLLGLAVAKNGFFQPTNVGSLETMNLGNGPFTPPSGSPPAAFNGVCPIAIMAGLSPIGIMAALRLR